MKTMKTMKTMKITAILAILSALLLVGCGVSSAYLLTEEYTNPDTGKVEHVKIPVSQYTYELAQVGDSYTMTIHTLPTGIRTAVIPDWAVADLLLAVVATIMTMIIGVSIAAQRDHRIVAVLVVLGAVFLGLLFISR